MSRAKRTRTTKLKAAARFLHLLPDNRCDMMDDHEHTAGAATEDFQSKRSHVCKWPGQRSNRLQRRLFFCRKCAKKCPPLIYVELVSQRHAAKCGSTRYSGAGLCSEERGEKIDEAQTTKTAQKHLHVEKFEERKYYCKPVRLLRHI